MILTTIERVLKCMEICNHAEVNGCDGCPYIMDEDECLETRDRDIVKVLNACKNLYTETSEKSSAVTYSVQSGPVTIHQKLLAVLQCVIQGEITDAAVDIAKELYAQFED